MTNLQVPERHPLTSSEHAQHVYVLLDLEGEPHGVYVSKERAIEYITDFLTDGEVVPWVQVREVEKDSNFHRVMVVRYGHQTAHEFNLFPTHYRV